MGKCMPDRKCHVYAGTSKPTIVLDACGWRLCYFCFLLVVKPEWDKIHVDYCNSDNNQYKEVKWKKRQVQEKKEKGRGEKVEWEKARERNRYRCSVNAESKANPIVFMIQVSTWSYFQTILVSNVLSFLFDPSFRQLLKLCGFLLSGILNISQVSPKDFYLASKQSFTVIPATED